MQATNKARADQRSSERKYGRDKNHTLRKWTRVLRHMARTGLNNRMKT